MNAEILRPLIGARERFTPPDDAVRAMPVILRIEKADPPSRTDLLEAAAAAAVAVCLDDRTAPDGEWHAPVQTWIDWQIRKVARRARGAHWAAVGELPGVTVTKGTAQARALLPTLVSATPKVVSRLQVGGTELAADSPGSVDGDVPLLLLNPHVPMTVGKAAAQVGHATMLLAARLLEDGRTDELARWAAADFACAVRPGGDRWDALCANDSVVAVRDAGYTEVAPNTVTVLVDHP